MEIEDGVIWVYGVGEDGIQAFADFGIASLIELIRFYKKTLDCSGGNPAAYAEWIRRVWRPLKSEASMLLLHILAIDAGHGFARDHPR